MGNGTYYAQVGPLSEREITELNSDANGVPFFTDICPPPPHSLCGGQAYYNVTSEFWGVAFFAQDVFDSK